MFYNLTKIAQTWFRLIHYTFYTHLYVITIFCPHVYPLTPKTIFVFKCLWQSSIFFFCQLSNRSHLNQPHKIRTSGERWLHPVSIGRCQKYYNKKGLRNWLLWSCPIIQVLVQCACCMLRTFSNGTKHYILEYLANGLQMQMTTINSCFCSRSKNYNNSYFCCSLFRINLLYHIYWQQKKLDILAKKKFYIIFFFTSQIITCGTGYLSVVWPRYIRQKRYNITGKKQI